MATTLTPTQKAAVEHMGNAAIVAAPGSGKTRVLVEKVAFLHEKKGISLEEILLVTFTEKAATEFKNRLSHRLKKPLSEIEKGPIGTLHSYLARLLRTQSDFIVEDEPFSNLLKLRTCHEAILKKLLEEDLEAVRFVRHFGLHKAVRLAADLIGRSFKKGNEYASLIQELRQEYDRRKREKNRLDFQDLEVLGQKLLEKNSPADSLKWILVDEFQDMSPLQWEILNRLHHPQKNFLVFVGDPRQSIYRFRGARPEIFWRSLDQIKSNGGSVFHLDENFRTRADILAFVNELSPRLFPDFPRPILATRPANGKGVETLPIELQKELPEQRETEANGVAQKLIVLNKSGFGWNEIAVLFRTRLAMNSYEEQFRHHDIPFETVGGELLLEQPEILTICWALQRLKNPEDRLSQIGLEDSPLKNLSGSFPIEKPFSEWLPGFFEESASYLPKEVQNNLKEFQNLCERLIEFESPTLAGLLSVLESLRKEEARIIAPPREHRSHKVRLLTVHAAKGLEFPIVVLADLGGRPSHLRPPYLEDQEAGILFQQKETGEGLKERLSKSDAYEEMEQREREADLEESKRLLYVALTRAQERLILPLPYSAEKKRKGTWRELLDR